MNKLAKEWIAALKSGKYKQLHEKLTDGIGYCCLGVACEISNLGRFIDNTYEIDNDTDDVSFCDGELNNHMLSKIGLTDKGQEKLIKYNDKWKLTFEQIATELESFTSEYFTK